MREGAGSRLIRESEDLPNIFEFLVETVNPQADSYIGLGFFYGPGQSAGRLTGNCLSRMRFCEKFGDKEVLCWNRPFKPSAHWT